MSFEAESVGRVCLRRFVRKLSATMSLTAGSRNAAQQMYILAAQVESRAIANRLEINGGN
jgi:hypothetical protein